MSLRSLLITSGSILFLAFALFAGAVQYRQIVQYQRGVAAEQAQQSIGAISGYEAAIHMYTPWSPLVERSAAALWRIGLAAEQKGETELALIAIRSLRSSFFSARSLFLPGESWIERANEKIVQLEQKPRNASQ